MEPNQRIPRQEYPAQPPMNPVHSAGERRVIQDSRGRYRKKILERIQTIRKAKVVEV